MWTILLQPDTVLGSIILMAETSQNLDIQIFYFQSLKQLRSLGALGFVNLNRKVGMAG